MRIIDLIVLIVLFPVFLHAQNEFERWDKKEYKLTSGIYSAQFDSAGEKSPITVMKGLLKFYRIFISDYDGDNCPFYPSCSSFAVQAVEMGGIFQGSLMFADRFMRDSNLFNRGEYRVQKNGRLFDPPEYYLMRPLIR